MTKTALVVALMCLLGGLASAGWALPTLFYSDLESGPNIGGKDDNGAFVTLYGRGFGTTRGSSTVTVGDGTVVGYPLWTETKIAFQLGKKAATGKIVVHIPGIGTSNSLPFTVRPGNIRFVAVTGDDGNPGSFEKPWRTLVKAKNAMTAGDITYAMNGVAQTSEDEYKAALSIRTDGTAERPIALIAYPGATVTVGSDNSPQMGIRVANIGITGSYWVIAELTIRGGKEAVSLGGNGCKGWRVIGNDMSCPNGDGPSACFATDRATYVKLFGNDIHDIAIHNAATVSKLYHAVYFSTDSNHIEVGWNTIRNNQGNRAIQFHSTPLDAHSGYNQFDLSVHDNLIENSRGNGINFATVDPSKGPIRAYNNVIRHVGTGPDFPDGSSNYAGIYVAGMTNSGTDGHGIVEIDNNTLVDCGSRLGDEAGAFSHGNGSPQIIMAINNNRVVCRPGEAYLTPGSVAPLVQGANNRFSGSGPGPAFLASKSVSAREPGR